MPTIDISGERFGKLTVIERDTSKRGGAAYWLCKCDCGNIKSIRGSNLRQANQPTRSCGKCITLPQLMDITSEVGKKYGRLTVIERDLSKPTGHHKSAYWTCLCECGNLTSVATSCLRNGSVQSCGCLKADTNKKRCSLDITGKRFGFLTALENTGKLANDKSYLWKCQCDCGKITYYSVERLNSNSAVSCGCAHRSAGEVKISQILEENGISFLEQYSFSDLCGKNNNKLRYDFAILDENGNPNRLIEFDGEQHYDSSSKFYTPRLVELDTIKNNYAKQHNYPLVRIPYSELRHLSIDLLLGDKYII